MDVGKGCQVMWTPDLPLNPHSCACSVVAREFKTSYKLFAVRYPVIVGILRREYH